MLRTAKAVKADICNKFCRERRAQSRTLSMAWFEKLLSVHTCRHCGRRLRTVWKRTHFKWSSDEHSLKYLKEKEDPQQQIQKTRGDGGAIVPAVGGAEFCANKTGRGHYGKHGTSLNFKEGFCVYGRKPTRTADPLILNGEGKGAGTGSRGRFQ